MNKVLFIGNYIDSNLEQIIVKNSKNGQVPFSSSHYNLKFLSGFDDSEIIILSAPLFGTYPSASRIKYFRAPNDRDNVTYCSYNNFGYLRNISVKRSLLRPLKKLLLKHTITHVIISELYLPYLKLIDYLKEKTKADITVIVLDLPQFSNLSSKKSFIYRFLKKSYISKIEKTSKKADNFVFLSKRMTDSKIGQYKKPFIISETLIEDKNIKLLDRQPNTPKRVLYSGTLNYAFGIGILLDAFSNSGGKYELVLAGGGEAVKNIVSLCSKNNHIKYLGLISSKELDKAYEEADVFINPRIGSQDFAAYSFPSKIGEFLTYEKPIVTFDLPSYTNELRNCLIIPKHETALSLNDAIIEAINLNKEEKERLIRNIKEIKIEYSPNNLARRIKEDLWHEK